MLWNAKIVETLMNENGHAQINFTYQGGKICASFRALNYQNLLRTLSVSHWELLPNEFCRIELSEAGAGPVTRIGHLIHDKWFIIMENK